MHPRGTCPPLPDANLDESSSSNISIDNTSSNNASINNTTSFHSAGGASAEASEDDISLHSSLGDVAQATPPQPPFVESPWTPDAASPPHATTSTWADMAQPPASAAETFEIHGSATYSRAPASRSSSQKRALETSSIASEKKPLNAANRNSRK